MRRIALAVGLLLTLTGGAPAVAGAVTPDYFTLPAGYDIANYGVAPDGQGNVWLTVAGPTHTLPGGTARIPALGRLVASQAQPGTANGLTLYPTPDPPGIGCCANQARSVAYNASDHKLYWVRSDGVVGTGDPTAFVAGTSTGMSSYLLPGHQDLWDVAAAKGPGAWFTEYSASNQGPSYYGDRVAYYNGGTPLEGPNIAIQNGNTQLNSLRYDAQPKGVTVDAAGHPWFAESSSGNPGYRIGTWSGAGDVYDEFLLTPCEVVNPCSGSYTDEGPSDVAIAPDGGIWFTNRVNHKFGRLDPSTHAMTQYTMASIGLPNGDPLQLTAAVDGTIWMSSYQSSGGATSALVRIAPAANPADAPGYTVIKTPGVAIAGIGADNAGNLWFAGTQNFSTSVIGRLAGVIGAAPAPPAAPGAPAAPAPAPAPVATLPTTALKPATIGTAKLDPPQVGNGAINTNQICVGPPEARCSVVYLVREHEYVTGYPSAKNKAKKPKPRTLATKSLTLKGGEKRKVTIKLNKLGQRILKGKGSFKVDFIVTQKLANGKTKTLSRKTLTMKAAKKKAKK